MTQLERLKKIQYDVSYESRKAIEEEMDMIRWVNQTTGEHFEMKLMMGNERYRKEALKMLAVANRTILETLLMVTK